MPSNEVDSDLMRLSEAANWLRSSEGDAPSVGTIRRWIAKGTRGVKLKGCYRGGQWRTSPAWIAEFNRRLNGPSAELEQASAESQESLSSRAHRSAIRRRLIEEGLIDEEAPRSVQDVFSNRRKARAL